MTAQLIDHLAALAESIGAGNLPGDWPLGFTGTLDLLAEVAEALDDCQSVLAKSRRHTEHFRAEVDRLTAELAKPVIVEWPGTLRMAKVRLSGVEHLVASTGSVTIDGVLVIDALAAGEAS